MPTRACRLGGRCSPRGAWWWRGWTCRGIWLVGRYGLQASHLGVGLVLAALALVMVQKRLWLAARIAGWATPGEALAGHYGSVTIRIAIADARVLFALPFSATLLSGAGDWWRR